MNTSTDIGLIFFKGGNSYENFFYFILLNFSLFAHATSEVFSKEDLLKIKPIGNNFYIDEVDLLFEKEEINLKFLATWCPKCQEDIKNDRFLEKKYIYIFGNYGKDNEDIVTNFLLENQHIAPSYFDTNNYLRKKFNISKVPSIIFVKN